MAKRRLLLFKYLRFFYFKFVQFLYGFSFTSLPPI
jgi:hypothetical protein